MTFEKNDSKSFFVFFSFFSVRNFLLEEAHHQEWVHGAHVATLHHHEHKGLVVAKGTVLHEEKWEHGVHVAHTLTAQH